MLPIFLINEQGIELMHYIFKENNFKILVIMQSRSSIAIKWTLLGDPMAEKKIIQIHSQLMS